MNIINDITQFIWGNVVLRFLATLIITIIVAFLLKVILKTVLKPLAKKTKTKIDDIIIRSLSSIIFYVVLLIGIKIGLSQFQLTTNVFQNLVSTLLVLIVSIFLFKIIGHFANLWMKEWKFKTKTTADERLIPFLQKILKAVVIILAVIFIFSAWNINISPLLATAGIAGLAIGLAVKDSLTSWMSG